MRVYSAKQKSDEIKTGTGRYSGRDGFYPRNPGFTRRVRNPD